MAVDSALISTSRARVAGGSEGGGAAVAAQGGARPAVPSAGGMKALTPGGAVRFEVEVAWSAASGAWAGSTQLKARKTGQKVSWKASP